MSATTGIHTAGVYGNRASLPWTGQTAKTRRKIASQKKIDHGPTGWLSVAGQMILTLLYSLAMLPLMIVGAFVAIVAAAWTLLVPALVAGLVIVLVSYVVGGMG